MRPYLEDRDLYIELYILDYRLLSRKKPQTFQQIADKFDEVVAETLRLRQKKLIEQIENRSINKEDRQKPIPLPLILTSGDKAFINKVLRPTLNNLELHVLDYRLLSKEPQTQQEVVSEFKVSATVISRIQEQLIRYIADQSTNPKNILPLTESEFVFIKNDLSPGLSKREKDILSKRLLSKDPWSHQRIADKHGIARTTVHYNEEQLIQQISYQRLKQDGRKKIFPDRQPHL